MTWFRMSRCACLWCVKCHAIECRRDYSLPHAFCFYCLRKHHPALRTASTNLLEKSLHVKSQVAEHNSEWVCTSPALPRQVEAKWKVVSSTQHWNTEEFQVEHQALLLPTSLSVVSTMELLWNLKGIFPLFAHTIRCESLRTRKNAIGVVCEPPLLRVVWATITSEQQ